MAWCATPYCNKVCDGTTIASIRERTPCLAVPNLGRELWPICFTDKEISDFLRLTNRRPRRALGLQAEGAHVVEHILLRPRAHTGQANAPRAIDHEFLLPSRERDITRLHRTLPRP